MVDGSTRGWKAAAALAAVAMLAWLGWHAVDAALTLQQLRESHSEAAHAHDAMLRLEAEVERTAQLAIATGQAEWVARHTDTERRLRRLIETVQVDATVGNDLLNEAIAALDEMSRLERTALALLEAGRDTEAFELVTGAAYAANVAALGRAIRQFDDDYHDWMLEQSLGLTRGEAFSLVGALLLYAVAIGAWLLLVKRLERKTLALSREKATLSREIEARTRAESKLLRAQKFQALGAFSGTIAHDVDNVLSAVAGYAALADTACGEQARRSALAGLDRAVRHGRGLTRNLLSFARNDSAMLQPVDLGTVVHQTSEWLLPLLPTEITLAVDNEVDGPLWVEADPVQLQQAIINLALNARDAMTEGGTLTVTLSRCAVDQPQGSGSANRLACIGIRDTGIGMDPVTLRQAREPFFSTKPAGKGTGLGLVSAERVAEAMGGALEIESAPGAGTQVRIVLPERADLAPSSPAGGTATEVLLASDNVYWRELLAHTLEESGMPVREYDDPQRAAVDLAHARGAALLILDWTGPPASAVACLRSLRAGQVDAPVILLLDDEPRVAGDSAESDLVELALVVSRAVRLGDLVKLAHRLAERKVVVQLP